MYRLIMQSKQSHSFKNFQFPANQINFNFMKLCKIIYDKYFKPKDVPQLFSDITFYEEFDLYSNQDCAKYSTIYLDKLERNKLNKLSKLYQKWANGC